MSGFQQSALLNFFNESNAMLVQTLAVKFGFDAAEAMSHVKGLDTSPVLTKTKKTKKTKDPNAPKRSQAHSVSARALCAGRASQHQGFHPQILSCAAWLLHEKSYLFFIYTCSVKIYQ